MILDSKTFLRRRNHLNISQEELAKLCGVSRSTIIRYENGTSEIPKYMDLLFKALFHQLDKSDCKW